MKDFKIGDSVRVKDTPNPEWMPKMPPLPDAVFKVEGTQNDKLILSRGCSDLRFVVGAELFELVESPDPKTAFLTEMQSLLRKYDAKIYVWSGEDGDMSLTFGLKDNIDIRYPNEWCTDYKFEFPITPDNIFNYEKE